MAFHCTGRPEPAKSVRVGDMVVFVADPSEQLYEVLHVLDGGHKVNIAHRQDARLVHRGVPVADLSIV